MSKILSALLLALSCGAAGDAQALEPHRDLRENLAREFEGTYRFNYLFAENGVVYLNESSHFQVLDFDRTEAESTPRITFFNQTSKGKNEPTTVMPFTKRVTSSPCGSSMAMAIFALTAWERINLKSVCWNAMLRERRSRHEIRILLRLERAAFSKGPRHGQPMNG